MAGPLPELGGPAAVDTYLRMLTALGADSTEEDAEPSSPEAAVMELAVERASMFDYQLDLSAKIISVASQASRERVGLVALPTGAGKTRTAIYALLELFLTGKAEKCLWLAPTRELLGQAQQTFATLWRMSRGFPAIVTFRCDLLGDFPKANGCVVYLATPQMINQRLKVRSGDGAAIPDVDILIFDEAHFAVAPTFRNALRVLQTRRRQGIPIIGLSATPGRADAASTDSLVELFRQRLLISDLLKPNAVAALQALGILAELRFERIPLVSRTVGQRKTIEKRSELGATSGRLQWDMDRLRAVQELFEGPLRKDQALLFAGSVRHALAIVALLLVKGLSAALVSAYSSQQERVAALDGFAHGRIQVLANKSLLATGYDCPTVGNVVLTMPVGSPILFEQIVGRAARGPAVGGSAVSTVWSLDNNLGIHGLPQSYYRFRDFDWR